MSIHEAISPELRLDRGMGALFLGKLSKELAEGVFTIALINHRTIRSLDGTYDYVVFFKADYYKIV